MRIQLVYDSRPDVPDEGESYFQCARCMEEWRVTSGVSPRDYARQQVSIHPRGLQVWCTRHDVNIAVITPQVAEECP